MNIDIIEETKEYLIVYKPSGFATQSANAFAKDAVSEVTAYLAGKEGKIPYVGLVHRLDQPVEGLLVFAKNKHTAANLSSQLSGANKISQKEYLAVVCVDEAKDLPIKESITMVDYLGKDSDNKRAVITSEKEGKRAELTYEVLQRKENLALVRIHLKTGRFHQIRAQFASRGMSLIGDRKYASELSNKLTEAYGVKHVALCASKLTFLEPGSKKEVVCEVTPQNPIFRMEWEATG